MDKVAVTVRSADLILRTGLCVVLREHPLFRVEADEANAEVLVFIEDALTDATLEAVRKSRAQSARHPKPPCLVITDGFPAGMLLPAIEAGIVAILPRAASANEIASVALEMTNGAAHLTPQLQGALLGHLDRIRADILEPNHLTTTGLNEREREVLMLIAQGLETAEVAQKMRYSERTVKNILHGLMTRLHLQNRAHAVAYAIKVGAI